MDAMIYWMNKYHSDKYVFKYSTPGTYVDAVKKYDIKWPTKYDDMFPYSDHPDSYWTGYFTSRPNHKGYIHTSSQNLHASSQLYAQKVVESSTTAEETTQVMNSHVGMLDALGVAQHHDAISGTAKMRVADDYSNKLNKAIINNNPTYAHVLNERLGRNIGYKSVTEWTQCVMSNTTYLDCPVVDKKDQDNFEMYVAVHNPSAQKVLSTRIPVPNGKYEVETFCSTQKKWVPAPSTIDCHVNNALQYDSVTSCHLNIDSPVANFDVKLLHLKYTETKDKNMEDLKVGDKISSSDGSLTVTFESFDDKEGFIMFNVCDSLTDDCDVLKFETQWWTAWVEYNRWIANGPNSNPSGVYIFRPIGKETHPYNSFKYGTKSNGKTLDFYLDHEGTNIVNVHVSIEEHLMWGGETFNSIKFIVDSAPLPNTHDVNTEDHEQIVRF